MRELEGKVSFVTGGTSGIGEATVRELVKAGSVVVFTGRRIERGETLVGELSSLGEVRYVCADVRNDDDMDGAMNTLIDEFGRVDVAFNNAGIFDRDSAFHEYSHADWLRMLDTNLTSVFRSMQIEIRHMLAGGGGCIINNASTVAHRGSERASPAYVAAKHAVLGLTRQAALEYAQSGIRVNAVSPGPTLTEVTLNRSDLDPEPAALRIGELNPQARLLNAVEVARGVVFLASEASSMINGHSLALDGGQLARL